MEFTALIGRNKPSIHSSLSNCNKVSNFKKRGILTPALSDESSVNLEANKIISDSDFNEEMRNVELV